MRGHAPDDPIITAASLTTAKHADPEPEAETTSQAGLHHCAASNDVSDGVETGIRLWGQA
jgi:hypothetical protein